MFILDCKEGDCSHVASVSFFEKFYRTDNLLETINELNNDLLAGHKRIDVLYRHQCGHSNKSCIRYMKI